MPVAVPIQATLAITPILCQQHLCGLIPPNRVLLDQWGRKKDTSMAAGVIPITEAEERIAALERFGLVDETGAPAA